jgi:hypothetical protein
VPAGVQLASLLGNCHGMADFAAFANALIDYLDAPLGRGLARALAFGNESEENAEARKTLKLSLKLVCPSNLEVGPSPGVVRLASCCGYTTPDRGWRRARLRVCALFACWV